LSVARAVLARSILGGTHHHYAEQEAREQAYYDGLEEIFQEGLKSQAKEAVKSYLGRYGDAVDQRVLACITEAKVLLKHGHFGPSLCAAAIAVELMIRFMLVRPLVQGAFLSDEWAGILTDGIVNLLSGCLGLAQCAILGL
jgi:hypothetical protein